jgi:CBS domain-containing protein
MQVKDVMTRGVECATPHDTIAQAAHKMRRMDIGSLPICGDDDRLAGMITDRDITIRATADGCVPGETPVAEAMTRGIVYCFEDQDITDAASLMEEKQIRRLVVLDRSKRLVGIVSLGDLAVKSQNDRLSGEALERVSEPAMPVRI